jgi:uncharacterized membrane protein
MAMAFASLKKNKLVLFNLLPSDTCSYGFCRKTIFYYTALMSPFLFVFCLKTLSQANNLMIVYWKDMKKAVVTCVNTSTKDSERTEQNQGKL